MPTNINYFTNFNNIPIIKDWSFSDKTTKETSYITHGYYTYPAKFIPQLVSRLLKEHTNEKDIIIDPFMGSGTTIVEAIINRRIGVGVDINDISYLLAKVKTTPIEIPKLLQEFIKIEFDLQKRLNGQFQDYLAIAKDIIPNNERLDYWFKNDQKDKLSIIYSRILEIKNKDIQDFFYVAFAQILKSCSIWLQKSIKPTRDPDKKLVDPLKSFLNQSKKMIKRHFEFDKLLTTEIKKNIQNFRIIENNDSRNLPCENNNAKLIITSPPYVTSYEYADLHQLPLLWFGHLSELVTFRKKFIGSSYTDRKSIDLKSNIADRIITDLGNTKKAKEVKNYFADMLESFIEMKRVLKKGGKACVVIGNTQFKGVDILNAEVFYEQFKNLGFVTFDIIQREIPSKMLPSIRDRKSGQFIKANGKDIRLVYPTEYILIMEKK